MHSCARLPITQQFLRKPCSSDGLRELLERACSLRSVLHNRATLDRIGRLKSLPTTPQTFQALAAATAREDAHLADITGIVSKDTALAVKTLQIVNSAFFRRSLSHHLDPGRRDLCRLGDAQIPGPLGLRLQRAR